MIFMFSDHSYLARRNSWEQFLSARERLDREVIMLSRAIAFIYFFRKSLRSYLSLDWAS